MMGFQSDQQPKLFYPSINLEQRIPERHILRRIRNQVDFDFIYDEVRDCYGSNGNVSVPPPALLKMMLLLVLYNVRSERELMNREPSGSGLIIDINQRMIPAGRIRQADFAIARIQR